VEGENRDVRSLDQVGDKPLEGEGEVGKADLEMKWERERRKGVG
jgi:hypothetical protein